jgi:hypothetical protein
VTSPDQLRDQARALRGQFPERRQATPSAETGRRIGTVHRSADEEIRVNWCEYQGRPYVSVRMCEVVRTSAGRSEGAAGRPNGGAPGGPREQRGWDPDVLPAAEAGRAGSGEFNEFSDRM